MLMFVCGLAVLLAGSYCCIHLPDAEALEQAALLPFADDPQAARSMSRATGRVCQEVSRQPSNRYPAPRPGHSKPEPRTHPRAASGACPRPPQTHA